MAKPVEEQGIEKVEQLDREGSRELYARYLIDQYNKLCSWRHTRYVTALSTLSLLVAFWAFLRPLVEKVSDPYLRGAVPIVDFVAIMLCLLVGGSILTHLNILKEQEKLVCMLDQYRHIHKCLPENWDLRFLRYSTADVRKFLEEKGITSPSDKVPETH